MVDQYTIWNPGFYHMSGGIRAIHQLKLELLKRGINAAYHDERRSKDELMIYPEIISGNPCNSNRWIKWLLNKADFPGEECWAWETGIGNFPLLTVNMIEMDLWVPGPNKTNRVAYWIGKGKVDHSVIPDGAIEVSRNNFFDRVELARFISSLDYFISFDPFSAINLEATLTNTPVLIYGDNKWKREDIERQGWLKFGVAWSLEELDKARDTVYNSRSNYENLICEFDKRIDNFIKITMQ